MSTTPFHSLEDYIALPRIEGLALSPDGRHAVLTVATLKKDGTGYERALWQVSTDGSEGARRLTRSAKGEASAAFTSSGDLLFVSARPDAGADADDENGQLWVLPAEGGEARPVTRLAGGAGGLAAVAEASDRVVIGAGILPGAATLEDDARLRSDRSKHKVSAILHESYPVRFWDHDLGPDEPHLLAIGLDALTEPVGAAAADAGTDDAAQAAQSASDSDAPAPYPSWMPRPLDLTPAPASRLDDAGVAVTPDGVTVVASLPVPHRNDERFRLVAIDVPSGTQTVLLDEPGVDFESPTISHDGSQVAFVRTVRSTPAGPEQQELWVFSLAADVASSDAHRVVDWDRWPTSLVFDADDRALIVTADQDGRGPIFRVPLEGGQPQQLTHDDFTYADVHVDRARGGLVALRSSWMVPPHPVRITSDGAITELEVPGGLPTVPATMTEVETTAEDSARVRGWLLTPDGASSDSPAPLLLWIHGGPLNSWNAWSWRWNPQLAVARGYAVLLSDPALSTGYGLDFIARGWNNWGGAPYTDLMAITDAVAARPEIDDTRTAAMGGSFGGYMANWVAGHTDRFRAIVTHASLWSLDQFIPTTDLSPYWNDIFTKEGLVANSPHRFIDDIRTPMLVVHGDNDYRVPIGEGLRLWSELNERFAAEDGSIDHRFLYFPDENHWVLKPQHAVIWYETVFAFLAQHVLGEEWARPARLG
ncbi:alpha/beta fold hydrolase [Humibacter sp. RRB41]|uniref:S9 family peptidase n=1 Tax=Humibacter sp. RRB41 TaxID=2919946 RepID=UPI001FA9B3B0|nr:alpha/beta fold hydrolase [Humibacter sp. RRB41]